MDISLSVSQGLFSHMQESICHVEEKRVPLDRFFHQAIADFQWLEEDLIKRPTRLYKLVPLQPTQDGYQNDSGYMCGGAVLLGPTMVPRTSA